MINQGLNTIELLKDRKAWLKEEIKQVDLALMAMGEKSSSQKNDYVKRKPSDGIQWSYKIDEVFKHSDGELNFEILCNKLVELGLEEAKDEKNRPKINACLSRKVKQGKIERVRTGIYRRKSKNTLFNQNQTEEIK